MPQNEECYREQKGVEPSDSSGSLKMAAIFRVLFPSRLPNALPVELSTNIDMLEIDNCKLFFQGEDFWIRIKKPSKGHAVLKLAE